MSTDDLNGAHSSLKSYQNERTMAQNSPASLQLESASSVSVLSMLNSKNQSHKNTHPLFTPSEYTASSNSFHQSKRPRVSVSPTTTNSSLSNLELAIDRRKMSSSQSAVKVEESRSAPRTPTSHRKNSEETRPASDNTSSDSNPVKADQDNRFLQSADSFSDNIEAKPGRRFRRRYNQIVRKYSCAFPGCNKSYGSLNHLNTHIVTKKHGQRKSKADFHYSDDVNNNLVYHSDYSNGSYWYLPHQSQYLVNQQLLANQQVPMHVPMPYQRIPPGYVVYGYPGAPPPTPGMPPQLGAGQSGPAAPAAPTSSQKSGENTTQSASSSTISPSALPGTMAMMPGQIPAHMPQPTALYHHLPTAFSPPLLGHSGVANPMPLPNVHSSPTAGQVPIRVMPSGIPVPMDGQNPYMMPNPNAMLRHMNYPSGSLALKPNATPNDAAASPSQSPDKSKQK